MRMLEKLLNEKSDFSYRLFWNLSGPIFLCLTTFLASASIELVFWGVLGFFLSCRFGLKGSLSSIAVLGIYCFKVFYLNPEINSSYFLALACSYAASFMITGLNWTRQDSFFESLFSQIDTKQECILNLEDEIAKSRLEFQSQQMLLLEKIENLQKLTDEAVSETSSFSVLNEVLRKTTAKTLQENQYLQELTKSLEVSLSQIRLEKKELEIQLDQIADQTALVIENKKLLDQLNQERIDKEQTHAINESVARLYAKEYQKTKSLEENLQIVEERNQKFSDEIFLLEEKLHQSVKNYEQTQQQLADMKNLLQEKDLQCLESLQKMEKSSQILQDEQQKIEALKGELFDLKLDLQNFVPKSEKLSIELKNQELVIAISLLQADLEKIRKESFSIEAMQDMQQQLNEKKNVESLYKQLKAQFDEKNQMLHLVRKELFQLDNLMQANEIEAKENGNDFDGDFKVLLNEYDSLQKEYDLLKVENLQLEDLVSFLQKQVTVESKPKKKSK